MIYETDARSVRVCGGPKIVDSLISVCDVFMILDDDIGNLVGEIFS